MCSTDSWLLDEIMLDSQNFRFTVQYGGGMCVCNELGFSKRSVVTSFSWAEQARPPCLCLWISSYRFLSPGDSSSDEMVVVGAEHAAASLRWWKTGDVLRKRASDLQAACWGCWHFLFLCLYTGANDLQQSSLIELNYWPKAFLYSLRQDAVKIQCTLYVPCSTDVRRTPQ